MKKKLSSTNHSPSDCVCFSIRSATRAVTALYDTKLTEVGMTNGQFTILRLLAGREALRVSELKDICQVEQSTMSREIKTLCRKEFVSRLASKDARERLYVITNSGKQAFTEATDLWEKVHHQTLALLGDKKMNELLQLLEELRSSVRAERGLR